MALSDIKLPGEYALTDFFPNLVQTTNDNGETVWAQKDPETGQLSRWSAPEDFSQQVQGESQTFTSLLKEGYVPLDNRYASQSAATNPASWDYFNKTYGTNIHSAADYYKIIYQMPNAEVVNDPKYGPMLNVGPGAVEKRFLNYNPNPNEELLQALKYGGAAFAAAGLLSAAGALSAGGGAAGTGAGAAGTVAGEVGGGAAGGAAAGAAGAAPSAAYWNMVAGEVPAGGLTTLGDVVVTDTALTGAAAGGAGATIAGVGAGVAGGALLAEALTSGVPGGEPSPTTETPGPNQQVVKTEVEPKGLTKALTSLGVPLGLAETIASLAPGASVASILAGLAKAGLGYYGAEKQADAYETAAEKQAAATREAIAYADKARTEQNAAYAKAHDEAVAAREVQNSYIRQAMEEVKKGQASQDAAIQSGIDFSKGASDKYFGIGAPYRSSLEASYKPGFSVFDDSATKDAATQAANFSARSYSATSGNPFDQPTAQGGIYRDVLSQVALPQLNKYRDQLGTFGQMGLSQAGTMDQLTTSGLEKLGNNDLALAPYIAQLGGNAFQGINYTANQADTSKITDYIKALGDNAYKGTDIAGSGLDAIAGGITSALNPPITKADIEEMLKKYQLKP